MVFSLARDANVPPFSLTTLGNCIQLVNTVVKQLPIVLPDFRAGFA